MKRKFFEAMAVCCIISALAGCGSTGNEVDIPENENAAVTESATTETAKAEEAAETLTSLFTEETKAETETAALISSEKYTPSEEEKTQIQSLLKECKKFFYDYYDGKEIQHHKDENKSITVTKTADNGMFAGESYEETLYEITDGEVMSMGDMYELMKPLFTEKMSEVLKDDMIRSGYYEKDGKLYITDGVGSNGGLLGTDTVHITSVGKIDNDTFVLYMNAFGAGENWDLDYDTSENFTVILKKTEDGFKMDECDRIGAIEWCYTPEDDVFGS
ncbi:MAG: hypothetical protein K2K57_12645 [Oscillospiraceae bacterium]|nr:hypothetical protein [Oscillospiraceae bacterium]